MAEHATKPDLESFAEMKERGHMSISEKLKRIAGNKGINAAEKRGGLMPDDTGHTKALVAIFHRPGTASGMKILPGNFGKQPVA